MAISKELSRAGVEFSFLDGVDGRKVPIPRDSTSSLKPAEAACSLGHLRIYEDLLASGQSWGLVFEDDVTLEPDFPPVLAQINLELLDSLVNKPVVLLLGGQQGIRSHFYFVGVPEWTVGRHKLLRSFHSDKYLFRTCGYLINRMAASGIVSANRGLTFCADDWEGFVRQGAVQELHLLRPGIVVHPSDLAASTIQGQRGEAPAVTTLASWADAKLKIAKRLIRFFYLSVLARIQQ